MAKGDPPPDTSGEVPTWFMTYSDVVTLLMTFFILLLTFASSDPEHFEKVQISLSGEGGSTGFADPMLKETKRDSFAARIRPKASRWESHSGPAPSSPVNSFTTPTTLIVMAWLSPWTRFLLPTTLAPKSTCLARRPAPI